MRPLFLALMLSVGLSGLAVAADPSDVIAPVSQRYAAAEPAESPDFQRHLVPLLGKLGCNGRACHGSFQGRGGFQLSLFGYDFKMDHSGLSERIDTDAPTESYALQKALNIEPHEGGKRFTEGSWEHHLFLKWIQDGGKQRPDNAAALVKLDVQPAEILFQNSGEEVQIKAVAIWADGSREDVTCLCRFASNDDAIADVTSEGHLTSGEVGDTHVVVSYDNAVVPVPVIRPVSDQTGDKYPQIAASKPVDLAVVEKLSKLGIIPSDVCDDAEFLRRVSLDIAGTLPSSAEVRAFLADSAPDKRERKINALLETPAYAAWWTTKICDWTGCNDNQLNNVNPAARQSGSQDWYNWVLKRVQQNMPYDDLMEGIVVAESKLPNESYRDYCERMSEYYQARDGFAENPGLIYFWGRQNFRTDEDRAIGFAYTFMGTRIQCAQCHKHPFDVWTQDDFQQFEKFFTRIDFNRTGSDRSEYQALLKELGIDGKKNGNDQRRAIEDAVKNGKTIPFPDITIESPKAVASKNREKKKEKAKDEPVAVPQMARLLGSDEVDLANIPDPRVALMNWLRNDPKQLFAKALVNRVWANYFHRGIVEPTDDLSLANPPSNQKLLDYLATEFVKHDYDLKWLHREICLSDTYQRSWRPNATNAKDERNFSHAVPRRLPAEVAYDALVMATAGDARAATFASDLKDRAVAIPGVGRNNNNGPNYALTVFGRSTRESNCDCDRSAEASLLQVIFTRNDNDMHTMIARRDGWAAQLDKADNDREVQSQADVKVASIRKQLDRAEDYLKEAKETGKEKRIDAAQERVNQLEKQLAKLQPEQPKPESAPQPAVDVQQLVEDAYLRTLCRLPSADERKIAAEFLADGSPAEGARSLLWTLVNTKEFIVNH